MINNCNSFRSVIPPLSPARYRLSGRVEQESLPPKVEIKVKFTSVLPKSSSSAGGKVIVSQKGTFSIYLPAGKYVVSVELGPEQKGNIHLNIKFCNTMAGRHSLFPII